MEKFIYEGLPIEYNGYSLSGLYSFTIMQGNYDVIYLSKTKVKQLKQKQNEKRAIQTQSCKAQKTSKASERR